MAWALFYLQPLLQEQRHLDALVVEEADQALAQLHPVAGHKALVVQVKQVLARVHQLDHLWVVDAVAHGAHVVQRHIQNVRRVPARDQLVLEPHGHQVVQLVHAGFRGPPALRASAFCILDARIRGSALLGVPKRKLWDFTSCREAAPLAHTQPFPLSPMPPTGDGGLDFAVYGVGWLVSPRKGVVTLRVWSL